jgi:hypothetical protein
MARLLAERDSTQLHLTLARRHERLARRYRQDSLADTIKASAKTLQDKADLSAERDLDRQAAYDNVIAADADLDDTVRNLYNSAEIQSRQNPSAPTLISLFPDGGFTSITDEPLTQEPAAVIALATKVDSLGATHTLAPHAALLRTAAQGVTDALAAQETAIRASKAADAEEEIAAAALRRQYEGNYLDGRKTLGRALAERLFPSARNTAPATPEPTPTPKPV